MFLFLWFILVGIAVAISSYLGYGSYSWVFLAIISIFIILLNLITYFYSDKMVLRAYKAKIVTEREEPRLVRTVSRVANMAELPMPKVAVVPTDTPNAFSTGRYPDNAVVAATKGILNTLDDDELEGVIAHEMANVKDRDILVMTIAASVAMIIAFAARIILFQMLFSRNRNVNPLLLVVVAITAPIAALLVQLAISRSREYKADRVGAMTIYNPKALAKALDKLDRANRKRPIRGGNPATSSLFIVNPFTRNTFVSIFSTHPPMKERINRLNTMAQEMGHY
ncbi:MAG: zinc metalloprotease HtpX [Thermoplasmata archaeon]|nr:MAG: zinc metalloprotease HtpX [Thermoplasmata archaeon]